MEELLNLLENDARLTHDQLALMLDKEKGEIRDMIEKLQADGVIVGYKTMIDWDKVGREYVSALIELKITPQRERGFDRIAQTVYNYPEVESVYLVSGSFDLMLIIEGKTMREVAFFVAQKLAPLEDVVSTSTHFVLRKYKDKGIVYGSVPLDDRGNCN